MRSLLRQILREHRRRLPAEMRKLGDRYAVKEFRDHMDAGEAQLAKFESAWAAYLADLKGRESKFGADLSEETIDAMSDDQRHKLIDLRLSSR